nr:hypothetical protein [uncultured Pseudomonas sp.]
MSTFHDNEVLRAGKLGAFRVNALITRIGWEGDLHPESGSILPGAVALHVHEYIHYLHNLSTVAGLDALTSCLLLVQPFLIQSAKTDSETDSESFSEKLVRGSPEDNQSNTIDEHVAMAFRKIRSMRGFARNIPKDYVWKKTVEWQFTEMDHQDTSEFEDGYTQLDDEIRFRVKAIFADKSCLDFELQPGLDFITEGIAYEAERYILNAKFNGSVDVDGTVPSYPYLAFSPLVKSLVGRETSPTERIVIGTLSLLSPSPSEALVNICKVFRFEVEVAGVNIVEQLIIDIIAQFKRYADYVINSIVPMLRHVFENSKILSDGFEVYETLILTALNTRLKSPVMELAFLKQPMDERLFSNIALTYLERWISQEKSNGETEIMWLGRRGSVASWPPEKHEAFAVLQSSIHYVQHHFTQDGRMVSTEKLAVTLCPFSGACSVERDAGYPEECKTKPWRAQEAGVMRDLCAYELGVIAIKDAILST